jgi:hypothetical protein
MTKANKAGFRIGWLGLFGVAIALFSIAEPALSQDQDEGRCRCFAYLGEKQVRDSAFDMSFDNKCKDAIDFHYWRQPNEDHTGGDRQSAFVERGTHSVRCNGSRTRLCTPVVRTEWECSSGTGTQSPSASPNSSESADTPAAPVPAGSTQLTPWGAMTSAQFARFQRCVRGKCSATMFARNAACQTLFDRHRDQEGTACVKKTVDFGDACRNDCANSVR